jgi:hypothetical protein
MTARTIYYYDSYYYDDLVYDDVYYGDYYDDSYYEHIEVVVGSLVLPTRRKVFLRH